MAPNAVIAIVDDDDLVRDSLAGLLRSYGLIAEVYPSASAFLSAGLDRFDLVVTDLQMPGMTGLDLKRVLSERQQSLPVIIVTAYPERGTDLTRNDKGLRILEKPVDSAQLIDCIERVLGRPVA